jgi:hypothetical protein
VIFRANATKGFYGRYYFYLLVGLLVGYKILTNDAMLSLFFGTLWIPQIL